MVEHKKLIKRDESIDILKGFGIVFMIIAHTYGPNNFLWDAIYTFHMPLFFIITGFLYKHKKLFELFQRSFSQLIVPYIFACIIIVAISQIRQPHSIFIDLSSIISGLGPGWFLLALFLARIEFHCLLIFFPKSHIIVSLIISSCIAVVAHYNNWPSYFAFYPSLVSLVFISMGYYTRQQKLLETGNFKTFTIFAILSWLITFVYGKVEMSHCLFKLNCIDFAGSISGTYIVYKLSQMINANNANIIKELKALLVFTGRYSLVILYFHTIDYCIYPWYVIEPYISNKLFLLTLITINRFLFVYLCVTISIRSKVLRSFFNIKDNTRT